MLIIDIKNILLLEDRDELSTWLERLLKQGFPTAQIICLKTLAKAFEKIKELNFQLALVDLGLPDGSGLELIRLLASQQKQCFIVVITIFDDSDHLFAALKSGAHGYLLKDDTTESILDSLLGIIEGKPPISPRMALKMVQYFHEQSEQSDCLSEREKEVLSLIAKGHSVKEAAHLLHISWHTAGDHVKNIYKKLGINSRAQAAQVAKEMGL